MTGPPGAILPYATISAAFAASLPLNRSLTLRTPHAVAAVVAQVAVAVADGDGAAVVAAWGVELEAGELVAADGRAGAVHAELGAGPLEQVGVSFLRLSRVAVAVAITIGRAVAVLLACAST